MTDELPHDGNGDYDIEPLEFPSPEDVPYPPVLRLTSAPLDEHREDALDRVERWQDGETVPHVSNFQDLRALWKLLTARRIELLRSIMNAPPESIRALADRLDRGVKETAADVNLLADYEIVYFEQDGRAKQPYVPYETVKIEVEIDARATDETDQKIATDGGRVEASVDANRLVITFPTGERFAVPARIVVEHRAAHDTDEGTLAEWARSNMDWDDLRHYAERLDSAERDLGDLWMDADLEVKPANEMEYD